MAFTLTHILQGLHSVPILAWFSEPNTYLEWEGFMCNFGAHRLAFFQMKGILFVFSVPLLYIGSNHTVDLIVKFA